VNSFLKISFNIIKEKIGGVILLCGICATSTEHNQVEMLSYNLPWPAVSKLSNRGFLWGIYTSGNRFFALYAGGIPHLVVMDFDLKKAVGISLKRQYLGLGVIKERLFLVSREGALDIIDLNQYPYEIRESIAVDGYDEFFRNKYRLSLISYPTEKTEELLLIPATVESSHLKQQKICKKNDRLSLPIIVLTPNYHPAILNYTLKPGCWADIIGLSYTQRKRVIIYLLTAVTGNFYERRVEQILIAQSSTGKVYSKFRFVSGVEEYHALALYELPRFLSTGTMLTFISSPPWKTTESREDSWQHRSINIVEMGIDRKFFISSYTLGLFSKPGWNVSSGIGQVGNRPILSICGIESGKEIHFFDKNTLLFIKKKLISPLRGTIFCTESELQDKIWAYFISPNTLDVALINLE